MTTAEFAKLFAKTYNVRQQDADTWVRSIFEFLCEQCAVQSEIKMAGFGVMRHVYSPPRKYTDLHTGKQMVSEPHMALQFSECPKLCKMMKEVPVPKDQKLNSRRKSDLPIRGVKNDDPQTLEEEVVTEEEQE